MTRGEPTPAAPRLRLRAALLGGIPLAVVSAMLGGWRPTDPP
ncbi:hypothetical protein ABID70_001623 [Clavibacter michiganensis]|nr:hypothetical protein [Clavibacter michiganensis]MDQ0411627.1 hypothetical protein [Clavibacter michiganensis]